MCCAGVLLMGVAPRIPGGGKTPLAYITFATNKFIAKYYGKFEDLFTIEPFGTETGGIGRRGYTYTAKKKCTVICTYTYFSGRNPRGFYMYVNDTQLYHDGADRFNNTDYTFELNAGNVLKLEWSWNTGGDIAASYVLSLT